MGCAMEPEGRAPEVTELLNRRLLAFAQSGTSSAFVPLRGFLRNTRTRVMGFFQKQAAQRQGSYVADGRIVYGIH